MKARLRPISGGQTQLMLIVLDPVDWMQPLDHSASCRWNGRRLARHWEMPVGDISPEGQASFHRDGTDGIVVMDVIQTRASRRSDQLKLMIEAVRPKDQTLLDALAASELNDILLLITEQPTKKYR